MAGKLNLSIEQGATFTHVLTWKDELDVAINLTGATARMQVRDSIDGEVLIELTTENDRLSIPVGTDGKIHLEISATDTAAMTWVKGVYDLEVVIGSTVTRLVEGKVKVSKEVTR
jgi:hypothetical protein